MATLTSQRPGSETGRCEIRTHLHPIQEKQVYIEVRILCFHSQIKSQRELMMLKETYRDKQTGLK